MLKPVRSRGFTLVQLIISIAILAVLGAFVSLWLLRTSAVHEVDAERSRLWDAHQILQVSLERDFTAALLTSGESNRSNGSLRPAFHGIERFPAGTKRVNPSDNDELLIRFERDGHVVAPVNISALTGDELQITICIRDLPTPPPSTEKCLIRVSGSTEPDETFNYFAEALRKQKMFSITSVTQKDIVKIKPSSEVIGSADLTFKVQGYTSSQASSFNLSTPQIRVIETAKYFLRPDGILVREMNGIQSELAMNMRRFQVNYDFSRGSSFGAYWPTNQSPISSPLDLPPQGGLGQVQWMHLTKGLVDVSYLSPLKPRGAGLRSLIDDQWSLDQATGQLIYTPSTLVITPGLSRDVQTLGASYGFCPTAADGNPQVGARCKSECDHLFTSSSPQSARWTGYRASSNSNYCKCSMNPATGFNDYPGDNEAGRNNLVAWVAAPPGGTLSADQSAHNARIEACSTHYGCWGWVEQRFFPGWALCHNRCLQGNEFKNGDGSVNTTQVLDRLRSPEPPEDDNKLSCRVAHWCDQIKYNNLPDMPGGKWEQRCACLPTNLDETGAPASPNNDFVSGEFIRWGNICNLGFTPGGSGTRTCTNTMTDQGLYRQRSATNPKGLDLNQMAMCECLRTQPPEAQSRYYQEPNNRPNGAFTDFTFRSMWTFDMRAQNPAPSYPPDLSATTAPTSWPAEQQTLYSKIRSAPFNFAPSSTDLNFGRFLSPQARSIPNYSYQNEAGQTVTPAPSGGISCIDAYTGWVLDTTGWNEKNMGCCHSSDARCNNYEGLPSTSADLGSYKNYCNRRCGNPHPWAHPTDRPAYDQLTSEIEIIRRAITDTPPGQPLPTSCGGSAGGTTPGGGGSGTPNY